MRLISLKAAAAQLGIHTETLRRNVVQGRIPGAKLGGLWRFSPEILAKFIVNGGSRPKQANHHGS